MPSADAPQQMQLIGNELAIAWKDGTETYIHQETVRAESPSALNKGEKDIFGQQYGGNSQKNFEGVRIKGWEYTGNYGVRFDFSDGHASGIYSWDYLKKLGEAVQ